MDLSSLVPEFQAEATEHLDALNAQLLTLERDPAAPGPIRAMFLSAHTIKGSAAMPDPVAASEVNPVLPAVHLLA